MTLTMKLSGRFDEFKVSCEDCQAEIHPIEEDEQQFDSLFDGKHVGCSECGANAVATNDGGIWKLYETDTPLQIEIID